MPRIFFSPPKQVSCLPGHQIIGANRFILIKVFTKVVSVLVDHFAMESPKSPYPVRPTTSFPVHSRKELLMCPKEKATVATAAYLPIYRLCRVHIHLTAKHSGGQGFQNIFSKKIPILLFRASRLAL